MAETDMLTLTATECVQMRVVSRTMAGEIGSR